MKKSRSKKCIAGIVLTGFIATAGFIPASSASAALSDEVFHPNADNIIYTARTLTRDGILDDFEADNPKWANTALVGEIVSTNNQFRLANCQVKCNTTE